MSAEQAESGARKVARLDKVGVPRLLFALLRTRFTGRLELIQPQPEAGRRNIWFRGGMPVFTDWSSAPDRLGQILVDRRWLSPEALRHAVRDSREQGALLGAHLVGRGEVQSKQLVQTLREQCLRKLTGLFALESGEVLVSPETVRREDDGLSAINVLELLRRGVCTHYDESRVRREMGSALSGFLKTSAAFVRYHTHFGFTAADLPIIGALQTGMTYEALVEAHPGESQRVACLLYLLWATQMLETRDGAVVSAPSMAEVHEPPGTSTTADPRAGVPNSPRLGYRPPSRPQTTASSPQPPVVEASQSSPSRETSPPPGKGEFEIELELLESKITRGIHAFDLMGVSTSAGKREIRQAWTELSRKFHPDGLQSRGLGSLRSRVENVFAGLSEAHMLLSNKEKREELRRAIESGIVSKPGGPDPTALARAAIESEVIAKEGDKALRSAKFDLALERYEEALKLNPEEPDLGAAIAWCEFQLSDRSDEDGKLAVSKLDAVLSTTPNLARAHYFRGLVLVHLRNEDLALAAFARALALDPRLIDAERQARAIRARRTPGQSPPKGERKRFGLKGLFGKK